MVHKPSFVLIGGAPIVEDTVKGIRISSLSTNDMTVHPLSFDRDTDGWRTNKDGHIQRVPFNLLKDSQSMGTSAVWLHNSTNVTITNNSGIAPDGTNTAVKVENLLSNVAVYSEQKITASAQNTTVLTGGPFNYSVYAKAGGTGDCYLIITLRGVLNNATNEVVSFYFNLNTGTAGQLVHYTLPNCTGLSLNAGNGWYRVGIIGDIPVTVSNEIHCSFEFSSNAPTYNASYRVNNSTAGTIGYVWGAQLSEKKGTLTDTSNPYIATTDREDFARIDYSGSCPGILIEPARTNYVKYSQYFLNNIWTKGFCNVSATSITGPDGNSGRYFIDATAPNNYMRQTISQTISDNTYYTISAYVQKGQASPTDLRFVLSNGTAFFILTINLSVANPTVSNSTSSSTQYTDRSARIYSVGGGWYRVVGTARITTGGTGFTLGFGVHSTTEDYICYGMQIEEGRYETSYIKTGSDALTRGAERLDDSNIFSTYSLGNQTDGTIYMEVSYPYPTTVHLSLIFELSNTSGDFIALYRNGSNLSVGIYIDGGYTYNQSVTGMGVDNKIALGYSNSYFVVYLNGQQKILSNDVSVPFWDKLSLAKGASTPDARVIKSFAMYEDILRNEALEKMTEI